MAQVKSTDKAAARQENIQQTVSKTEQFYNENKKTLWGALIAVVVVILAVLAYNKFIYAPKCAEAMQQCYPAENFFKAGDYESALNGDGNVLGFAEIIDEYGAKAGKAVYLYAAACELNAADYEAALAYVKKYKGKDSILSARAKACEGDAYVGLEDYAKAAACFCDAAAVADNLFAASYLVKAGLAYEQLGKKAEALECYKTVKDRYPQSVEGYEIDRHIARVEE